MCKNIMYTYHAWLPNLLFSLGPQEMLTTFHSGLYICSVLVYFKNSWGFHCAWFLSKIKKENYKFILIINCLLVVFFWVKINLSMYVSFSDLLQYI